MNLLRQWLSQEGEDKKIFFFLYFVKRYETFLFIERKMLKMFLLKERFIQKVSIGE